MLEQITALYNFGQFQFSYGNYSGTTDYLYHSRVLSTDVDRTTSAHWGKLASDIFTGNWEFFINHLPSLLHHLYSTSSNVVSDPTLAQLHSRVHWSLFVYFNHPHGRILLLDTFMSLPTSTQFKLSARVPPVSSRVMDCPSLDRKGIQTEEYQYQDPVTILKELYAEFDFEAAQKR
ncbi:hypothetical protein M378DRAFT_19071 [Amanita muscaria Koide BX008]|uniref:Uncharacterized protein n=1 Tax=Amanita muscaria (strain Koide BX008) TaxID=946122 RepID=A0A0C2RVK7_AMAMK|nr:hypothetical protein M378DRAFT_19071 [Amanita muscaria Koide BX008]